MALIFWNASGSARNASPNRQGRALPCSTEGFLFFPGSHRYIPARQLKIMNPDRVLWIYIILLVIGGLIGFFKGKSQVSLTMSVAFAAALSLCAARIIFYPYVADILLVALLVVFAMRLVKTKKFMPSGLMLIITLVALALRNLRKF